jgi:hypothetical protein
MLTSRGPRGGDPVASTRGKLEELALTLESWREILDFAVETLPPTRYDESTGQPLNAAAILESGIAVLQREQLNPARDFLLELLARTSKTA